MPNRLYPANGSAEQTAPPALPRRARPAQIIPILEDEYHVPRTLIEQLCEAFGRAAVHVIDDTVADRKTPLAYYAVRRLDSETWWKR